MTDSNIYRIIDAFREGKEVMWHKRKNVRIKYRSLIEIVHDLYDADFLKCGTWFIDGVEVKDE